MNKTYEEILEDMKCTYFSVCGEKLDEYSKTARRFETVASELFALSCYGDYIYRQAFIQTATKDNLDRHGAVRNCERKRASSAQGILTFYIDEPSEEKIIVGKDTVCSVENLPYLQYATIRSGVIEPGETFVNIPAKALGTGYDYNVSAGDVTVMVNAPVGISGVRNSSDFAGGYDDESDSSYRDRIMKHYSISANGINAQSIANSVLLLDFITDCFIPDAQIPGRITAFVSTKDDMITANQVREVKNAIGIGEVTGASIDVQLAEPQSFSVVVEADIRAGFDKAQMKDRIENIIRESCSACRIGKPLMLNTVSKKLAVLSEISSFNIHSNDAYGEAVLCDSNRYLYLNNLAVNCFDE